MTAIVMTVAILAIYKLANMFQMQLKLSSLVFCGILALIINFLSITVSPFLDQYRFVVLGVMIFVSALITTGYNKYIIHRRAKAEAQGLEPEALTSIITNYYSDYMKRREKADEQKHREAEAAGNTEKAPAVSEDTTVAEPADTAFAATLQSEQIPDLVYEPTPESEAEPEPETEPEPEPELEPEPEAEPESDVDSELAGLSNLDDMLDYAFELKGSNNWEKALKAYEYALKEYSGDAYAPMLVIEICNIHKDNGQYQKAIDYFKEALSLPAVAESPAMIAEFEDSIAYLEATYSVLQENNQAEIPFYDIPKEYMSKIESIYNNRKSR